MNTVEELAKRLRIEVDFKEASRAYWAGDHTLTVKLLLDDEVISESNTYIPNKNR